MSKVLTIELPDEVYGVLERLAEEEGKTVQELGAEWLSATVERILNDPLEQVIGSLKIGIPNWSEHHDEIWCEHSQRKVKE